MYPVKQTDCPVKHINMIKIKIKKGRQSYVLKTDRLSSQIYQYDKKIKSIKADNPWSCTNKNRVTSLLPKADILLFFRADMVVFCSKSHVVSLLGSNADTTVSALKNNREAVL